MNKDKNIGFIGLGNVGSKIANNILKSKYNLNIYDIDRKKGKFLITKGAIWRKNISEIALHSSIIITCLPSPKIVSKVILGKSGLINFLSKKHLWIEMSTTDQKDMINLSKMISSTGAGAIEAPVTGGQHTAESGNISIFVGGKRKHFNRAFPILSSIGY